MPSLKRSLSCLLLCMLLLSASCSAKAKEFSKDGMHITLTDAFSEGKYYDMTAYYDWEEEDVTVSAMKEEFSVLEENGESTALSLEEFPHAARERVIAPTSSKLNAFFIIVSSFIEIRYITISFLILLPGNKICQFFFAKKYRKSAGFCEKMHKTGAFHAHLCAKCP